jgi:hypothetical protein
MKHPFHTLFYIGLSTMLFVGTFLSLLVINIKDILPSTFSDSEPRVVNRDVIVTTPIEILSGPTPQTKPIEKVIVTKKTEKTVELPIQGDSTKTLPEKKDSTETPVIKTP